MVYLPMERPGAFPKLKLLPKGETEGNGMLDKSNKGEQKFDFRLFFLIIILFYYSIESFKPQNKCSKRNDAVAAVFLWNSCLILSCFQGFLRDLILFDDINNGAPTRDSVTIECIDHGL